MFIVRQYKEEDFNDVSRIIKEAFSIDKVKNIFDDNYLELVAELNNKVVGYLVISKIRNIVLDKYYYHVDYVCVDSNYQNMGIGRELMLEVDRLAIKNNIMYIELTSNKSREAAHHLYEKLGYEKRDSFIFRRTIW